MNSSRSSRRTVLALLALAVALVVATPTAAISASGGDVPEEAQVGEQITVSIELTELYTDAPNSWTLGARTNLTNVTWTVRRVGVDGNQIAERSYDGQSFLTKTPISADENVAKVNVTIRGTVPKIENYTVEPKEEFVLAAFNRTREGGNTAKINTFRVHHFTQQSKKARNAIVDAEAAIAAAGGNVQDAEQQLDRAVSAYESGNFQNAISLANDARKTAQQQQQSQGRNRLLLFGGIGVAALIVIVGGVYYWRSRQDTYDKLR